MFSSEAYGQKNLLFKDSTSELVPIATQTYEAWLGREYLHAMKGLLCDPNRKSSCLFSRRPSPDRRRGQAFWRGGQRRTLTPEGVCVSWPRWEPVASTFLPLGVGEEDSGVAWPAVPWKPHLLQGVGSRPEGSPCPSIQNVSSPVILPPPCLTPPHHVATALALALSLS